MKFRPPFMVQTSLKHQENPSEYLIYRPLLQIMTNRPPCIYCIIITQWSIAVAWSMFRWQPRTSTSLILPCVTHTHAMQPCQLCTGDPVFLAQVDIWGGTIDQPHLAVRHAHSRNAVMYTLHWRSCLPRTCWIVREHLGGHHGHICGYLSLKQRLNEGSWWFHNLLLVESAPKFWPFYIFGDIHFFERVRPQIIYCSTFIFPADSPVIN